MALATAELEEEGVQMGSLLSMMYYLPHVHHALVTQKEQLSQADEDRARLKTDVTKLSGEMKDLSNEVKDLRSGSGFDLQRRQEAITAAALGVR